MVVADMPVGGHAARPVQGFKHVEVEYLVAGGPVEALMQAF